MSVTRRHIREYAQRGFAPHSVRHIVATHLVKNSDDGIGRAADALHNTRAMIQKVYGHIEGKRLTRRAMDIIEAELE
jgi:integrase